MQATAHLPGLKIDVLHQRSPDGDAEQISINLQAVPSFEAFSRYMENVNPLVLWVQLAQIAWFPWLQATRTVPSSGRASPLIQGRAGRVLAPERWVENRLSRASLKCR
jgi:hypothetical protein